MKKIKFTILLLLAVCASAIAAPRDYKSALAIAKRQAALMGTMVDGASSDKVMKKLRSAAADAMREEPYYVFDNAPGMGFTIVSGSDRMPEILGYSEQGNIGTGELPPQFVWFLEQCAATAQAAESGDTAVLRDLAEARSLRTARGYGVAVKPLLGEIKWNQTFPYNMYCPKYDGANSSATGCVATAMAQIMAYHRHPDTLLANIPAYTTNTYGIRVEGEAAGYAYNWDAMLPVYGGNETFESQDAVARLMSHCGKALQMDYGPSSGAGLTDRVFVDYFGYDRDLVQVLWRGGFSISEWNGIISRELVAARPVFYTGASSGGGHAFVCDGSDGNGLFHINWGWGGYQDGYFDLTVLNPMKGGTGSGNASDGYTRTCDVVVGIQPDNGVADEPYVKVGRLMVDNGIDDPITIENYSRPSESAEFSGTATYRFANRSRKAFNGYVALAVRNQSGELEIISGEQNISLEQAFADGRYYYYDQTIRFSHAFTTGVHKIIPVSRSGSGEWMECMDIGRNTGRVVVQGNFIAVCTENGLSAEVKGDDLIEGKACPVQIEVKNSSGDDYLGLLKAFTSTTDEEPDNAATEVFVGVESGKTKNAEFQIKPRSTGNLYLWVEDEDGNLLVDGKKMNVVQHSGVSQFKLVSVETNAEQDLYEGPLNYQNYKVMVPKTSDGKATVTYGVKNEGNQPAWGEFSLWSLGCPEGGSRYYAEKKIISAGATVYLTVEATEEELDSRFVCFVLECAGEDSHLDYSGLPKTELRLGDSGSGNRVLTFSPNNQFVYIGGDPSGVAAVAADRFTVVPGFGEATVAAAEACTVRFITLSGITAAQMQLAPGESRSIGLQPGIYIAGGKKIIIR